TRMRPSMPRYTTTRPSRKSQPITPPKGTSLDLHSACQLCRNKPSSPSKGTGLKWRLMGAEEVCVVTESMILLVKIDQQPLTGHPMEPECHDPPGVPHYRRPSFLFRRP